MRAYVDSDILIWHLRGKPEALHFLNDIYHNDGFDLWIGAMQRGEIVFFMRDNEKQATMSLLSHFKCAPVDAKVIDVAAEIYRNYSKSTGVGINDAILSATVQVTGGKIFSLNTKHFPKDIVVSEKPW